MTMNCRMASQATNDKSAISHSSHSPTVILNEVKNRIVTKGKPNAEILHFVQNDIFSLVIFACLMQSLGSANDKQKKLYYFCIKYLYYL